MIENIEVEVQNTKQEVDIIQEENEDVPAIVWRTTKGMKKQHIFRFDHDQGIAHMHCRADTISIDTELIEDDSIPKCKKCEKEILRVKNLEQIRKRRERLTESNGVCLRSKTNG